MEGSFLQNLGKTIVLYLLSAILARKFVDWLPIEWDYANDIFLNLGLSFILRFLLEFIQQKIQKLFHQMEEYVRYLDIVDMERAENKTILEVFGQYGLGLSVWFRIKMVKLLHGLKIEIVHDMQRDQSIMGIIRKAKKEGVCGLLQQIFQENRDWIEEKKTKTIPEEWLEFFGLKRHQLDKTIQDLVEDSDIVAIAETETKIDDLEDIDMDETDIEPKTDVQVLSEDNNHKDIMAKEKAVTKTMIVILYIIGCTPIFVSTLKSSFPVLSGMMALPRLALVIQLIFCIPLVVITIMKINRLQENIVQDLTKDSDIVAIEESETETKSKDLEESIFEETDVPSEDKNNKDNAANEDLIALGMLIHDAVITILKNNQHQEKNVQDVPKDSDIVAIEEAETEIKSEEFFLDLERSNIDETDLEPETDDDTLDDQDIVAIEEVGTKNIREARYILERIQLLDQMDKDVQEEHEEYENSETLAIEKADNETKNEDYYLYKGQIIVFGHADQTDLEPKIDDHDDLDDWVILDHE